MITRKPLYDIDEKAPGEWRVTGVVTGYVHEPKFPTEAAARTWAIRRYTGGRK